LGDTIRITQQGAVLLTEFDKAVESITYTFNDDEDDDTKIVEQLPKRGAILENQLRNTENRADVENRRKNHQEDLFDKRQSEGIARWSGGKDAGVAKQIAVFRKFESYRRDVPLPRNVGTLKVLICYVNQDRGR
jgi:nucleosome binding factor SPN SPT16 subunit